MTFTPMPTNMRDATAEILSWREQYKRDTAEIRRLNGLLAEWQKKAATWLATPEAASRLEGYRDLAQKLNAALVQRDVCVLALQGMVDRFSCHSTDQEDQPKTFGCNHVAETCQMCEGLVTGWKAVREARAALAYVKGGAA